MISLIYFTYRPGGFDLLIDSLKRQKDADGLWELVVVDDGKKVSVNEKGVVSDVYYRDVSELIKEAGLPLRWYGRSKEKKYRDARFGVANAMNTGLRYSKGDIMLYVHDYTFLNPNALRMWCDAYTESKKKLVVGVGKEHYYNGKFLIGDCSIFDPPFESFDDDRFHWYHDWIPEEFELFYSAYPREFIDDIGGFDEKCDFNMSSDYLRIVGQAKERGYKLEVDKKNWVNIVNHRQWKMIDPKLWNVMLK